MTFGEHLKERARFRLLNDSQDARGWSLLAVEDRLEDRPQGQEILNVKLSTPVGQEMGKALEAFLACMDTFEPSTHEAILGAFITTLEVMLFS